MVNRRLAVAVAGLAVAAAAVPGHATMRPKPKPKPSCLMLTDPAGDAKIQGQGSSYDADDIVSADIATGRKTIVGVLRLKSGDGASGLATGSTYRLSWTQTQHYQGTTRKVRVAFFLYVYATGGASAGYGVSTDANVEPTAASGITPKASIDAHGVITWVLNRKDDGLSTFGVVFGDLWATTTLAMNAQTQGGTYRFSGNPIDSGAGHASYTDLQPSCVRAS